MTSKKQESSKPSDPKLDEGFILKSLGLKPGEAKIHTRPVKKRPKKPSLWSHDYSISR